MAEADQAYHRRVAFIVLARLVARKAITRQPAGARDQATQRAGAQDRPNGGGLHSGTPRRTDSRGPPALCKYPKC